MSIEKSISVVVPVYNEEENAAKAVESLLAVFEDTFAEFEIIIIESGSTDNTAAIADELASAHDRVRVLHQTSREGLGSAIRLGFASASCDFVLYVDGDEPFDVAEIRRVIPYLDSHRAVVGYRIGRRESLKRRLYSCVYNLLIQCIFKLNVRDVNFSMKVVERGLLQSLDLRSNGCFYDAELLIELRRRGVEIVEVGFEFVPRGDGKSSLDRPRIILGMLGEMISHVARKGTGRRERSRDAAGTPSS